MSRPTHFHPKGPSVQGTTSPSLGHLDSPSSFSSPSSSFASTPTAAMASPATVYSDNLYQIPSRHQTGGGPPQSLFVEFVRAHPKGTVRFRPFEDGLDAGARNSIDEFRIYPSEHMEEYCRHIPYASGKKDFFEKTGRESFEVFQYVFKMPGDDKEYHVMWDYNVGLVRMTPFFKCCKYSKTTPAKMLNLNPGLRDITHSITGGSIMAQGYWMPYSCAKAVCATFCYHIAGALIPIFGPEFPSECLPPQSPDYGRMVIDPVLVEEAIKETECMRQISIHGLEDGTMSSPFHESRRPHRNHGLQQFLQQKDLNARPPSMHLHSLPPLSSPYIRPVPMSSIGGELKLAPINFALPRRGGALLPSPIERERLPPLSHITSLPPLPHSGSTLPRLSSRDEQDRRIYGYPLRSNYASGSERSPQWSLPSLRAGEAERQFNKGRVRPGDYPRCFESDCIAPDDYGMTIHSKQLQRPPWDASQSLVSSEYRSPHSRREDISSSSLLHHVDSKPHSSKSGRPIEYRDSDTGNGYDGNEQASFASSYCYPSPPRAHSRLPYPVEIEPKRPLASAQFSVESEGKYANDKRPSEKTTTAGSRDHAIQHRSQQKATRGRRKLKFDGSATGLSSSSSTWNATDVDAAEVLVNFSVKVQASDDDQESDDSDQVEEDPDQGRPTQKTSDRRFAASISSLLCDDAAPRKKRRGI